LDNTAPSLGVGRAQFVTGTQLVNNTLPVHITWSGSDSQSGINHYLLWQSTNGQAYTEIAEPTTNSYDATLSPGHKYKFAIGAYDNAGNFGGYVYNSTFRLKMYQETAPEVTYPSGAWTSQAITTASAGALEYSTAAAQATFAYTGSAVAWVSTVNTNRGAAKVNSDGGANTTVDTHAASLQYRRVVYQRTIPTGSHTLNVQNVATAGHPRVDVDAFLIISPP
jgi:hypothetical protein